MTAGEEQLAIQLVEAVQTIAQQLEKLAQPPETVLARSETWEDEQAEATARQDRQVNALERIATALEVGNAVAWLQTHEETPYPTQSQIIKRRALDPVLKG